MWYGTRAEANSAHNRQGAPELPYLSSLPPKPQLGQELLYLYLELDASEGNVPLGTVGDVCLD